MPAPSEQRASFAHALEVRDETRSIDLCQSLYRRDLFLRARLTGAAANCNSSQMSYRIGPADPEEGRQSSAPDVG